MILCATVELRIVLELGKTGRVKYKSQVHSEDLEKRLVEKGVENHASALGKLGRLEEIRY